MEPPALGSSEDIQALKDGFNFALWVKNRIVPIIVGGSLVGGGMTLIEKVAIHPADHSDAVASHTNEAKMIAANDSTRKDVEMVVGAVGNLVAMVSVLQNQSNIIQSDLLHDPTIMKIERQRLDSVQRSNAPKYFSAR